MLKRFNNPIETSTYLLAFALLIEVGVAALAIYLGLMTAQIGSNETNVTLLNKTMGPLLFVVVALIELTRVPLLISIYRGRNFLWRVFGSIFLVAIMFLAFETLLTAFQMNGAMVTGNIDKTIIDKRALSERTNILQSEIDDLSSLTQEKIDAEYDREVSMLYDERDKEIDNIDKQLKDIELTVAQSTSGAISNKENILQDQKINLVDNKKIEILNLTEQSKNKDNIIKNKIAGLQNQNNDFNSTIASGQPCTNWGAKDRISCQLEKEYNNKINDNDRQINELEEKLLKNNEDLDREINKINTKYDENLLKLNNQISDLINEKIAIETSSQDKFSQNIENLREDKILLISNYKERLDRAKSKKTQKEKDLENSEKNIVILKNEKIALEKEISDKRDRINELTRTNPNYILAKNLGGIIFPNQCSGIEDSSDVSAACYGRVTGLFWGSISFVVAITGTVVAIGSEVLRSTTLRQKKYPKGKRPIRYLIVGAYKYFRKPKTIIKEVEKIIEKPIEVVKEVPVQKVEFTEVPKIQEVIKKEIVHVPLYTNDESLIDIHKDRKKKNKTDESN